MDSLKDLVTHLKTCSNGASMGELREVLPDEFLLKQFVKAGLDSESIFSEGKKRGTRYYAKGMAVTTVKQETPKKQEEVYEDTLEHSDLDAWLKSDKPIPGQGVFTKKVKFGKDDDKLTSFLKAGVVVDQFYVSYDKVAKKNVVVAKVSQTVYNRIGFRQIGRKFSIQKYNTHNGSFVVETFDGYEEFREHLRVLLAGA